jgi:hypothetical protein
MTALYEHSGPRVELGDVRKIVVECVAGEPTGDVRDDGAGVLAVEVAFDLDAYLAADDPTRRRMAIAAVHAGALRVAELRGWSRDPFEAALATVIEKNYVNEFVFGKPRQSSDRLHYATLTCTHDPDRFRAWLVVTDQKRNELARKQVIDDLPSDFAFGPKLGKVAWISRESVALYAHDGSVVDKVTLPKPKG